MPIPVVVAERRSLEIAVDEVREVLLQMREHLVRLGLRELPRPDRCVELRLRLVHERVDETVDGLAVRLRDIRERLAVPERLAQLRLGDSEVRRRRIESRV